MLPSITNFDLRKVGFSRVYMHGELPPIKPNRFYAINLDSRDGFHGGSTDVIGTHWALLYVDKSNTVFIDAFGMPPPPHVRSRVNTYMRNNKNSRKNSFILNTNLQSIKSSACGYWVIYFKKFIENIKKQKLPLIRSIDEHITQLKKLPETEREQLLIEKLVQK